jgi:hypothetical protein
VRTQTVDGQEKGCTLHRRRQRDWSGFDSPHDQEGVLTWGFHVFLGRHEYFQEGDGQVAINCKENWQKMQRKRLKLRFVDALKVKGKRRRKKVGQFKRIWVGRARLDTVSAICPPYHFSVTGCRRCRHCRHCHPGAVSTAPGHFGDRPAHISVVQHQVLKASELWWRQSTVSYYSAPSSACYDPILFLCSSSARRLVLCPPADDGMARVSP